MSKIHFTVDYPVFKIVKDGGISTLEIGEGRLIPVLIIDIKEYTEIAELIKLHTETPPGDTQLQWSLPISVFTPKIIYLNLEFSFPMELTFGIEFNVKTQYALIDGIIQSRAFYLSTGKPQDIVIEKMKESILIEVPKLDIDEKWDKFLIDTLKKRYKKSSVSKKEIISLTNNHIKSMRSVWNHRRE